MQEEFRGRWQNKNLDSRAGFWFSARMSQVDVGTKQKRGMMLLALGVVFGDIGTSPLYAFETALTVVHRDSLSATGVASLIIWTLFLVVTVKYAFLVMRADYHGEGGIFALLALLREKVGPNLVGFPLLSAILVFGAALLFGDGAITPAISILSAVEGMEAVHPALGKFALPTAAIIVVLLFLAQRFGTGGLGRVFGPIMLLWFSSLGVLGLMQIIQHPAVLEAFNPWHGWHLLQTAGLSAGAIVGAVVLAVTGAEALYADLGHFGRPAILKAWRWVVFPALILNYLGQAAFVQRFPETFNDPNLFFLLMPEGMARAGLVLLATAATVIASQALISGVFSLCHQAIDLGYLPRFYVRHTSPNQRGQIYIPLVNFLLGSVCLLLILGFRSSAALAGAYGIAVTGAMIITSLAFVSVVLLCWQRPLWQGGLLLLGLLAIDLPLFASCLGKLFEGGMVPMALAIGASGVMLTWKRGRELVHESMSFGAVTVDELSRALQAQEYRRSPGVQIFVVRKPRPDAAIACMLEQYRRVKVVGENLVILLLEPSWENALQPCQSVHLEAFPGGLWIVRAKHGFMTEPNVPKILERAWTQPNVADKPPLAGAFYVVSHELVLSNLGGSMPGWQKNLFSFLSRNVLPGPNYLQIPANQLIVYNWVL